MSRERQDGNSCKEGMNNGGVCVAIYITLSTVQKISFNYCKINLIALFRGYLLEKRNSGHDEFPFPILGGWGEFSNYICCFVSLNFYTGKKPPLTSKHLKTRDTEGDVR